jgi:ubiquinone/menaquinone biosynthesis C-methylase UbiE
MTRVVKPGGRAVVLEFVRPPKNLVGRAYRLYLRSLLPTIGGAISGQPAAYRYLSDTVDSYRTPAELRELAGAAGWSGVMYKSLVMGTVGILSGTSGELPA